MKNSEFPNSRCNNFRPFRSGDLYYSEWWIIFLTFRLLRITQFCYRTMGSKLTCTCAIPIQTDFVVLSGPSTSVTEFSSLRSRHLHMRCQLRKNTCKGFSREQTSIFLDRLCTPHHCVVQFRPKFHLLWNLFIFGLWEAHSRRK